uniref:Uncharacterized protein n=1 Tax=viral metagenome TaxID=1070528 RepID=A0A6H2A3D5_9ZZZZ
MIYELELVKMIKTLPISQRRVLVKSKLYLNMFPERCTALSRGSGYLIGMMNIINSAPRICDAITKIEREHNTNITYLFYLSNGNNIEEYGCYIHLDLFAVDTQLKLF